MESSACPSTWIVSPNRIDLSVLFDLTDQHLKDLGIALDPNLEASALGLPAQCSLSLYGELAWRAY